MPPKFVKVGSHLNTADHRSQRYRTKTDLRKEPKKDHDLSPSLFVEHRNRDARNSVQLKQLTEEKLPKMTSNGKGNSVSFRDVADVDSINQVSG